MFNSKVCCPPIGRFLCCHPFTSIPLGNFSGALARLQQFPASRLHNTSYGANNTTVKVLPLCLLICRRSSGSAISPPWLPFCDLSFGCGHTFWEALSPDGVALLVVGRDQDRGPSFSFGTVDCTQRTHKTLSKGSYTRAI